jgi:hypothetical protein
LQKPLSVKFIVAITEPTSADQPAAVLTACSYMLKIVSVPVVSVGLNMVLCFQLSLFQYLAFVTDNGGTLMDLFIVWVQFCNIGFKYMKTIVCSRSF